jgi:hypothetical protein
VDETGEVVMGSATLGGDETTGTPPQWPDRPPRDLAIRLADALQYERCGPQDLWDEIGDWLGANGIAPPAPSQIHLICEEYVPSASRQFVPRTQQGSPMQLSRLVYTSSHNGVSAEVIDRILQKSRANNVRDLITGALIVCDRHFMQLIEGSRSEIGKCFMRIMQDRRHYDIQVISCGDVSLRLFQEWNMHLIRASKIKREIMTSYMIDGSFKPGLMSEFAIEDLCRTLARGNWEANAA